VRAHSLILAIVVGAACTTGDARDPAIIVRDSSGVTIVENDLTRLDKACTIAAEPTLSIGIEEGDENYMLAQLGGAVRLSDGRIVLANRATDQIRYFDAQGKFLYAAGRTGEGPGEFREPFYIFPTVNDTILVGDFRPYRYLVFSPEGKWVRTISLDPMQINTPRSANVLRDGRPVLGFSGIGEGGAPPTYPVQYMNLLVYGADGVFRDSIGRFPNGRSGQTKPNSNNYFSAPMFEAYAQVRARGDRIITGHASRTELRVQAATDGYPLQRIIRWDPGDLTITPADIEAERARVTAQFQGYSPSTQKMFKESLEEDLSPARPVADAFPAFVQLRVGTDDAIWISEFPRPTGDTNNRTWTVFETDGRFRCRLTTPRFAEFYEFGSDYLLVQDPDSLDVERVRSFPLRKP
jgi:hypothetical protein